MLLVDPIEPLMVSRLSPLNQFFGKTKSIELHMRAPKTAPVRDILNLPARAKLYPQALVLPKDLSDKEWERVGHSLKTLDERRQWWLGDWWRFGSYSYGKRAAIVAKGMFPYTFETLMTYGWVAAKVKASIRIETLSFGHHQQVAPLPQRQQKWWLRRAAHNNWSVKVLGERIHDRERQTKTEAERAQSWFGHTSEWLELLHSHVTMGAFTVDPNFGQHLAIGQLEELTEAVHTMASGFTEAGAKNAEYLAIRKAHAKNAKTPPKVETKRRGSR
jgi:hypothetical protein